VFAPNSKYREPVAGADEVRPLQRSVGYQQILDDFDRNVLISAVRPGFPVKHPDTLNQEMLKDRSGSIAAYCTAQCR
jgi:hypothetical protein